MSDVRGNARLVLRRNHTDWIAFTDMHLVKLVIRRCLLNFFRGPFGIPPTLMVKAGCKLGNPVFSDDTVVHYIIRQIFCLRIGSP